MQTSTTRRITTAIAAVAATCVLTTSAYAASPSQEQAGPAVAAAASGSLDSPTKADVTRAVEVALAVEEADTTGLHGRLKALPDTPTAAQTAAVMHPGDIAAQKNVEPLLKNGIALDETLIALGQSTNEPAPAVAFGWWDETKFLAKCGAAIAGVALTFLPAGSSVKVVRAVALAKKYGAKKTATILWRFVNGKRVGSKEREMVKALIGITAISNACTK